MAAEGFGADLSFQVKADATVEDVFCVIAGKEENAGRHTFLVSEGDGGLVCIDDGRKLTLLALPERPAVLVSRNGTPTWHEITGGEEGDFILGLDESGSWTWYQAADCEEACE